MTQTPAVPQCGTSGSSRTERLILLGGARALMVMFGLASLALIARRLDPAAIGSWSILLALQGYALQISEHGLRSVITAEGGRDRSRAYLLLPTYLRTRMGLAALVYGLACLIASLFVPEWFPALALLLTSLFTIALFIDWLYLVEDRPLQAAFLLLIRPGLFLVMVVLYPAPLSIELLAAGFAMAWAAAALLSWCLPGSMQGPGPLDIDPGLPGARALLRQGRPLLGTTLIGQALLNLDLLIVGLALGLTAAGNYFLAISIVTAAMIFANAAGQIAMARLGQYIHDRDGFEAEIVTESSYLAWIATALVGLLAVVAEPLIQIVFGQEYHAAGIILVAMLPGLWFAHQSALLQAVLTVDRQQDRLFRVALMAGSIMVMGLLVCYSLELALAFALLRGVIEACRTRFLLGSLDEPLRRRLILAWASPLAIGTIAVSCALYLRLGYF